MLIVIPNVLDAEEVEQFRHHLLNADWDDGLKTAGGIAKNVKKNQQLDDSSEPALSLRNHLLRKLSQNPTFISAALPDKIYPPKFNKYEVGETYGNHIDNALMPVPGTGKTVRGDVSCTLFFSNPDEYEGGELTIETQYGRQEVKLPAGDMVLYPSTSLHRVQPVTKGARIASFFWTQSMVRDATKREILFNLDKSVQNLTAELGSAHNEVVQLSGLYHNLIRTWANPTA